MNTTLIAETHENHENYVEPKTDEYGVITDSRVICECGTVLKDWSN